MATEPNSTAELARVATVLRKLKTIGALVVARGVGMRQADVGDQFTYLGSQVIDEADAGIAALDGKATTGARKRG